MFDVMSNAPQRIPAIPQEEWTDEVRDVFAIMEGPAARETGSQSNVIMMLANYPELAKRFLTFNVHLQRGSTLPPRVRELVILRVSWRNRCEYEWRHHMRMSPRVGLTLEECAAVKDGPEAGCWTELEQVALVAADQLCDHGRVDGLTWDELARHFDQRQMLDLLFTVGSYTMLGWVLNSVDLQLEPGHPRGFEAVDAEPPC